jgi:hypothetical protein
MQATDPSSATAAPMWDEELVPSNPRSVQKASAAAILRRAQLKKYVFAVMGLCVLIMAAAAAMRLA